MEGYNLDPNLLVNALGRNTDCNDGIFGGGGGILWVLVLLLFGGGGLGGLGRGAGVAYGAEGQVEAAIAKAQAAGASDQLVLSAISGNRDAVMQLSNCFGLEIGKVQCGISSLERGICTLGHQQSVDTASIIQNITSGDAAMSRQLADCCCTTQRSIDRVSREIADCCCETNRNIDSVKYDMATGFCSVNTNIERSTNNLERFIEFKIDAAQAENRAGFQGIRDYMTNEKIAGLQTELQSAQFQLSQLAQTRSIVEALNSRCCPTVTCCPTTTTTGLI